jgi:type II secretory pathway component PulF
MIKYKIIYQDKGKIKSIKIHALGLSELKQEKEYPKNVISVEEIKPFSFNIDITMGSVKKEDILSLFYELDIMLQANLPLPDAVDILLSNNKNNSTIRNILKSMMNAMENGTPIYQVLKKYKKVVGYLPIAFFKLGEENGNVKQSIHSLYEIMSLSAKNKKLVRSKLNYPIIIDGRNIFDPEEMAQLGFEYICVGRQTRIYE